MSNKNLDYAAIQRNLEKSVLRQKRLYRMIFFWMHLLFFVVAMGGIWGVVATNDQLRAALFNNGAGGAVIVILPTILWATAILCHIAALYTESSSGERSMREQLLMREIGEEILRTGLVNEETLEKPKRRAAELEARRVLLSDDGELSAEAPDEQVEQTGSKPRSNYAGDL